MLKLIAGAVGAVFIFVLFIAAIEPREGGATHVSELFREPRAVAFSFEGPAGMGVFGTFDNQQLQRGFQVYKEVCAGCHSLSLVPFRALQAIGFSEAEVKAIADDYEVATVNERTGEPATRKALPSDAFPSPFANEVAARAANNNAYPPDLSLIVKAREGGADYIHSLLTGYEQAPPGHEVPTGLYYNPYFANLNIAMPPPLLSDGQVSYNDNTQATIEQMSRDVTAFLTWAAEPKMMARRQTGLAVIIFLTIATVLAYLTYRRVWADLKRPPAPQPAE